MQENGAGVRRLWPLFVGLPLISLLALGAVLLSGGGGGGAPTPDRPQEGQRPEQPADLGTPSLGREDAPVVLTEYSDYQ